MEIKVLIREIETNGRALFYRVMDSLPEKGTFSQRCECRGLGERCVSLQELLCIVSCLWTPITKMLLYLVDRLSNILYLITISYTSLYLIPYGY